MRALFVLFIFLTVSSFSTTASNISTPLDYVDNSKLLWHIAVSQTRTDVTVGGGNTIGDVEIKLTNNSGEVVYQEVVPGSSINHTINTENFAQGVYSLTVTDDVNHQKFTINL